MNKTDIDRKRKMEPANSCSASSATSSASTSTAIAASKSKTSKQLKTKQPPKFTVTYSRLCDGGAQEMSTAVGCVREIFPDATIRTTRRRPQDDYGILNPAVVISVEDGPRNAAVAVSDNDHDNNNDNDNDNNDNDTIDVLWSTNQRNLYEKYPKKRKKSMKDIRKTLKSFKVVLETTPEIEHDERLLSSTTLPLLPSPRVAATSSSTSTPLSMIPLPPVSSSSTTANNEDEVLPAEVSDEFCVQPPQQ